MAAQQKNCVDTGSSSSSGDLNGNGTARPAEAVRRQHSCCDLLPAGANGDGGDLRRGNNARPADPRRRSYGDILTLSGGGDGGGGGGKPWRRRGGGDKEEQKPWEKAGYVSFEDLIGTSSFWDEPEVVIVGGSLRRTTSRLSRPRRRTRSPGPLGTRRGSTLHGVVKKYVNPFIGFLAGIFCCTVSP